MELRNKSNSALVLMLAVVLAGLIIFAAAGTTSRLIQDDYCYAAILRGPFFERQLTSYLQETTYSANRYSLTLGMGVSGLFGPVSVQILPAIILVLWVIGLYLLLTELARRYEWQRMSSLEYWLVAALLVFLTLALTPNWIQVFYWRAGMLPYTAPLVSGTWLFWLVLRTARTNRFKLLSLAAIFLLAVLSGGFSETAGAVLVVLTGLTLFVALIRANTQRSLITPLTAAFIGSVTALALLILSPSTSLRLKGLYGGHAPWADVAVNSLKGGLRFFYDLLYDRPLYVAGAFLIFTTVGYLLQRAGVTSSKPVAGLKNLLILTLAIYAITVAAMAPSFYAEASAPGDRALNIPVFFAVILLAAWASALGRWIASRPAQWPMFCVAAGLYFVSLTWIIIGGSYLSAPFLPAIYHFPEQAPPLYWAVLSGGLLLIAFLTLKFKGQWTLALLAASVIALMAGHIALQYPVLAFRADQWDMRDQQIQAAANQGQREVTVRALDSLVGIADLNLNAEFWVNHCAAAYYRLDKITVVEPVLDPIRIEVP